MTAAMTRVPEPGPIAVLPGGRADLVEAIEVAGGTVAPLSDATRAVVWDAPRGAEELAEILDAHPGVGWVQLPWAGVDAFADVLATHSGPNAPLWTSAKGAYSAPVAEHALALVLGCLRELPEKSRRTSWSARTGESLHGRKVLVIGAGGVALEFVRLLTVFDVEVTIIRRRAEPVEGVSRVATLDALDAELPLADVVVVAAAATGETARLFDERRIALMRDDAVFVNIARGSIVDTEALARALEAGRLYGAGIDVTDPEPLPDGHPLWTAPRVVITCHSADTDEMTAPLLAGRVEVNVGAFLTGGAFEGIVDPVAGY